jgi:hypothetical protein
MVPYFQDPSLGLVQRLVSLAYPVGDVLLLALAARLATTPGRRTASFRLLVASLTVTMAADTLFSVLALSGASVAVTDGMYLVDYLLLGAAGLPRRWPGWCAGSSGPRASAGGCSTGPCRRPSRSGCTWPPSSTTGPSSAWPYSPTTWSGPSSGCSATRRRWPGAAVARVEHAQAALSAEVQGLRELMVSLRPPTLDEVGLEAALRDHGGGFARRSGVACSVRVDLPGRLDGELETVVYRVTQEALLNVARHAEAGRLWLELDGAGDRLDLVADSGTWPAGP